MTAPSERADIRDVLCRYGPRGLSTATAENVGVKGSVSLVTVEQIADERDGEHVARYALAHDVPLTAANIATLAAHALPPGAAAIPDHRLPGVLAAAIQAVERSTRTRTGSCQTVEQAVAPRFLPTFAFTLDRRNRMWATRRVADPVRGGAGDAAAPLDPRASGGRIVDRWRPRHAVEVTPTWLAEYARGAGVLALGEMPDWSGVLDELRQLARHA